MDHCQLPAGKLLGGQAKRESSVYTQCSLLIKQCGSLYIRFPQYKFPKICIKKVNRIYDKHKLQYLYNIFQITSIVLSCALFTLICTETYMECLGST